MPPKIAVLSLAATISRQENTSMAENLDINSQVVTKG